MPNNGQTITGTLKTKKMSHETKKGSVRGANPKNGFVNFTKPKYYLPFYNEFETLKKGLVDQYETLEKCSLSLETVP